MRNLLVPFILMLKCLDSFGYQEDLLKKYPHVVLTNGIIETSVFLPDAEKGFYRSTRFEWSGMMYHLTWKGHSFFLQHNEKNPLPLRQDHDPLKTDNAAGLADQFQDGPQREKSEKTVMVIGIGNLDSKTRKIVDTGEWKTEHGVNWVEFTHTLRDDYGRGYLYRKRFDLPEGRAELVISYIFQNTGTRLLEAQQYNHNFFTIDDEYIGANYEVQLYFPAKFETYHPEPFKRKGSFLPYARLESNSIHILKRIDVRGGIFSIMQGFGDDVSHHHGIIKNKKTGACVDISGDTPLSEFHFWADDITICPEFFIAISVKPGATQEWRRIYRFYEE